MTRNYDAESLVKFSTEVLRWYGLRNEEAELLADSLAKAESWGHASHGLLRLPWYCSRVKTGAINANAHPWVVRDNGPVTILDGDNGIGQAVAARAAELSIQQAQKHGVGVVGVTHSNHFGTAAYFTRKAAEQGYVSLLFTNASPAIAPWGGRERLLGTNPWSIAAPAGERGVAVMDMANTEVARGKVYAAHERQERIPKTWASGPDGLPTNDPAEALEGLMLPMSGAKGYVLSFMIDLLAGALTGSGMGTEVTGPYSPHGAGNCGHLFITLDIDSMTDREGYEERVAQFVDTVSASERAPGVSNIFAPGKLEEENARLIYEIGIPLPEETRTALSRLSTESGVPLPAHTREEL